MNKSIMTISIIITAAAMVSPLYAAYHGPWPPCAVMTAEGDTIAAPRGQVVTGMICRSGPFAPDRFQQLEILIEAVQNTADEALTAAQNAMRGANAASDSATEAATQADRAQQTGDEALNAAAECCAKATRMFEKIMRK